MRLDKVGNQIYIAIWGRCNIIFSLKRPENHLICILSSVPSQKRPGGIRILFFWHFFCIMLKLTMKVFYSLNGILKSFLVLIMSASSLQSIFLNYSLICRSPSLNLRKKRNKTKIKQLLFFPFLFPFFFFFFLLNWPHLSQPSSLPLFPPLPLENPSTQFLNPFLLD